MKIHFMMHLIYWFHTVIVDMFSYKVGQTLQSLTLTKFYMQTKKKRREYKHFLNIEQSFFTQYEHFLMWNEHF